MKHTWMLLFASFIVTSCQRPRDADHNGPAVTGDEQVFTLSAKQLSRLEARALNGDNGAAISLSYIMTLRANDEAGIAWARLAAARGDCGAIASMFIISQRGAKDEGPDNHDMGTWRQKARTSGCKWRASDVVLGEKLPALR